MPALDTTEMKTASSSETSHHSTGAWSAAVQHKFQLLKTWSVLVVASSTNQFQPGKNVGTTDLRYLKLVTSNADIKETIRYAKTLSQQDFFSHNTNRHEVL